MGNPKKSGVTGSPKKVAEKPKKKIGKAKRVVKAVKPGSHIENRQGHDIPPPKQLELPAKRAPKKK